MRSSIFGLYLAVCFGVLWAGTTASAQEGAPEGTASATSEGGALPPASGPPPAGDGAAPPTGPSPGPGTATGPPPLGNVAAGEAAGGTTELRQSTATFPGKGNSSSGNDDAALFLSLGGGTFLLLGLFWLWSRGRNSAPAAIPSSLSRMPEPPFISAPIPPLSDGLQIWNVPPDDRAALLPDLLATLADRHRVLFVGAADVDVPRVAGGPVFRVGGNRPQHLEDPVHTLHEDGGRPVTVLLVIDDPTEALLTEFADVLPVHVGGVVIVSQAVEAPMPQCAVASTADGTWSITHREQSVAARRNPQGGLSA